MNKQIFPFHNTAQPFFHRFRIEQVAHADSLFQIFIPINRSDAPTGGTVLGVAQAVFLQPVLLHMVGQADDSTVADFQVIRRDADARLAQPVDFTAQMLQINNHAGTHDVDDIRTEDAGGKQVQNKLAQMVLNRMAGVIAALVTGDDIVIFREEIHHTAFALVPPVNTNDCC